MLERRGGFGRPPLYLLRLMVLYEAAVWPRSSDNESSRKTVGSVHTHKGRAQQYPSSMAPSSPKDIAFPLKTRGGEVYKCSFGFAFSDGDGRGFRGPKSAGLRKANRVATDVQ